MRQRPGWRFLVEETSQQAVKVPRCVFTLGDAVAAIRIGQHRELFVVRDQLVDQRLGPLIVAVVVTGPVNEEQVPSQLARERDR